MSKSTNWTDEEFTHAVATSLSIRQTLKALGLSPQGGNYQTVHNNIKRLGLNTDHWLGQAWNKGKRFHHRTLKDYLVKNGPQIKSYQLKKRLVLQGLLEDKCTECGLSPIWRNKPICLELHHKDGDKTNNQISNLTILCPNCHSQTSTHRGKNIRSPLPLG